MAALDQWKAAADKGLLDRGVVFNKLSTARAATEDLTLFERPIKLEATTSKNCSNYTELAVGTAASRSDSNSAATSQCSEVKYSPQSSSNRVSQQSKSALAAVHPKSIGMKKQPCQSNGDYSQQSSSSLSSDSEGSRDHARGSVVRRKKSRSRSTGRSSDRSVHAGHRRRFRRTPSVSRDNSFSGDSQTLSYRSSSKNSFSGKSSGSTSESSRSTNRTSVRRRRFLKRLQSSRHLHSRERTREQSRCTSTSCDRSSSRDTYRKRWSASSDRTRDTSYERASSYRDSCRDSSTSSTDRSIERSIRFRDRLSPPSGDKTYSRDRSRQSPASRSSSNNRTSSMSIDSGSSEPMKSKDGRSKHATPLTRTETRGRTSEDEFRRSRSPPREDFKEKRRGSYTHRRGRRRYCCRCRCHPSRRSRSRGRGHGSRLVAEASNPAASAQARYRRQVNVQLTKTDSNAPKSEAEVTLDLLLRQSNAIPSSKLSSLLQLSIP